MVPASPIPRHLGLDWLRVGAFAILIFYHIGMVFVPWGFHVRLDTVPLVTLPMLASNPWRLLLLFVVSGYATRALATRHTSLLGFVKGRSIRLLIPLVFGIAVLVPPQSWIELVTQHGYDAPFLRFWLHDYFGFRLLAGVSLPAWNHLWFVGYLWVYTIAIALLLAIGGRWGARVQALYDRVFGGIGGLVLPLGWLLAVNMWLFVGQSETHGLIDDALAHALYLPAFLFGFAMAGSDRVLATFRRWWWPAAIVALAAYLLAADLEWRWPGLARGPHWAGLTFSATRAVQAWAAIVALIGVAERFWNHDHPWRRTLTEAVFPFYLIHQTIIVVVAYWLRGTALPLALDAVVLAAVTIAGCWAFYLAGRAIPWARPLIGLRPTLRKTP